MAVFDACHSASLVRGVPDEDMRYRHVSPVDLGVPRVLIDSTRASAVVGASPLRGPATLPSFAVAPKETTGRSNAPEAVYFYAAQTTELTPEMRLPLGDTLREDQGLFSFVLRRALTTGRPMSYRQLGQLVLAQYGSMNQTGTTPLFAGNALDRLVFGQQSLSERQWPVSRDRMTVPVGTLSGLGEGARFGVVPNAAAETTQAMGYLRALRVGLNHAELEPMAWADKPALNVNTLLAGTYARLISVPERYALRVAVDDQACRERCRWRAVLDALRSQGVPGTEVQWVRAGGDLTLRFTEREVAGFRPGEAGQPECGPQDKRCNVVPRGMLLLSEADGDDQGRLARRLAERLHALARANNLMRLAARLSVPEGPGIEVTVAVQPAGAGASARRAATPETVTRADVGDRLIVELLNRGKRPVDVTLLHVDVRYGISGLFPRAGEVNRLEPGASLSYRRHHAGRQRWCIRRGAPDGDCG